MPMSVRVSVIMAVVRSRSLSFIKLTRMLALCLQPSPSLPMPYSGHPIVPSIQQLS